MNRIEEAKYTPHKVIKVYKQSYHRNYYLEQCNVTVKDGEVIVGPGKPLSKAAIRRIAGAGSETQLDSIMESEIMDPGILNFNPLYHKRYILWYRPQKKKKFRITNTEHELWMPAMIFLVSFDKLYLFSIKSNGRPTLATKLYVAPLLNLSNTYNFCWGSVKVSKDIVNVDEEVKFWEDKIWNSDFAHIGSKCSKREILSIYKELDGTNNRFPKDDLIKLNMTLEDAIKKFKP